ncbi:helix-turn-helix domain-containing protein [Marinobacter sp. SS21]|uniref:helix-turn-helix domain-containing protein n=1 Tax=Marinobacter sp. SS21 TaxID=2979460 RepID=UPI002330B438|nr:helix-turn-helix transcriptional regulator [Marinobacter sp. SS21]MDC0662530.1 helix-turn-helix transcriptional regulator [Marinobacter sp. SS21]
MQQPTAGALPSAHSRLYIWPDHWQVWGRVMPNRTHRHSTASLLVGIRGPFELECGGHWRTTRAALVAPDVPQALNPGETDMWVAQLDPDSQPWMQLKGLLLGQPSVDLDPAVARLAQSQPPDCGAMQQTLAALLAECGGQPAALDQRVAVCCQLLRREMPERLNLTDLATRVGLSPSRLTHLFRNETGVSPRRFLLQLKMHRAMASWSPGKTVSEIAAEGGFYDQPHLVRTARDLFDALPSLYAGNGWFQVCRCDPVS